MSKTQWTHLDLPSILNLRCRLIPFLFIKKVNTICKGRIVISLYPPIPFQSVPHSHNIPDLLSLSIPTPPSTVFLTLTLTPKSIFLTLLLSLIDWWMLLLNVRLEKRLNRWTNHPWNRHQLPSTVTFPINSFFLFIFFLLCLFFMLIIVFVCFCAKYAYLYAYL